MAVINCFIPIRIQVMGVPSDAQLAVLGRAVEEALTARIRFARGMMAPSLPRGGVGTDDVELVVDTAAGAANARVVGSNSQQDGSRPAATVAAPGDRPARVSSEGAAGRARVDLIELRFVCVFPTDVYGRQARRFARSGWSGHVLIGAATMEQAIRAMRDHARRAARSGRPVRIREIVIVAHGNDTGFLAVPLVSGRRGTTTDALIMLQKEFRSGKHPELRRARSEVLELFDDDTEIIVRACRVGAMPEFVESLASFFGGRARVRAPKDYQGFAERRVGGASQDELEAAFDFLVSQGLAPPSSVTAPEEKAAWVRAHFPSGRIPEMFLASREYVQQLRSAGLRGRVSPDGRDFDGAVSVGGERWQASRSRGGRPDAFFDGLGPAEILALARQRLAALRAVERDRPDDWHTIGELAWWVLRCHSAWELRRPLDSPDWDPHDPIGGLWMPGIGAYDTTALARQAARRPDVRVAVPDEFMTSELVPQATPVSLVPDMPPLLPRRESRHERKRSPRTAAAAPPAGGSAPEPTEPTVARLPDLGPMRLGIDGETGALPFGAAVRPIHAEVKIPLGVEWITESVRQTRYFKIKKAELVLEGLFGGAVPGAHEVAVSRMVANGRDLVEKGWKVEGKGGGWKSKSKGSRYVKPKVSAEFTPTSASEPGKIEASFGLEWRSGAYVGEVKVFLAFDIVQQSFKPLGAKFVPVGVQVDTTIPLVTGREIRFQGKMTLKLEIEPRWERIIPSIARTALAKRAEVAAASTAVEEEIAAAALAMRAARGPEGLLIVGGVVLTVAVLADMEAWIDAKDLSDAADRASAEFQEGFVSAYGVPTSRDGNYHRQGRVVGDQHRRALSEMALRAFEERHPNKKGVITVDDIDADQARIGVDPAVAMRLRGLAEAIFHVWVKAEFYRTWARHNSGLGTPDWKVRALLLGNARDNPPSQPDWCAADEFLPGRRRYGR